MSRKRLLLPLILVTLIVVVQLRLPTDFLATVSPDRASENHFLDLFVTTGSVRDTTFVEENLRFDGSFHPRGMVSNADGEVVPLKSVPKYYFLGTPLLISEDIKHIFSIRILITLSILMLVWRRDLHSFCLTFFLVAITLQDFPTDYYLLFYLLTLYGLLRHYKTHELRWLIVSGMFMISAALFRYDTLVHLFPILLVYGMHLLWRKRFLSIATMALFGFATVATIFLVNALYYGDIATFGYSLDDKASSVYAESRSVLTQTLLPYSPNFEWLSRAILHDMRVPLYGIVLVIAVFPWKRFKNQRLLIVACVLTVAYTLIYYGSNPDWTFWSPSRYYFSTTLILICMITLIGASYLNRLKYLSILLFVYGLFMSVEPLQAPKNYMVRRDSYIEQLPRNDIPFIVGYWDKALVGTDFPIVVFSRQEKPSSIYSQITKMLETYPVVYTDQQLWETSELPQHLHVEPVKGSQSIFEIRLLP